MKPPNLNPLSDDDYEALADLLADNSPFDLDGLLGVLHAVGVAPSLIPPSKWLHVVLPDGMRSLAAAQAQELFGLLMRLYNEVIDALDRGSVLMPDADDPEACDSFAEGFLAGAASDPVWVENDDHWTFASWAAYLSGKTDLIAPSLLEKMQANPEPRALIYRHMGGIVLAANDTLGEVRRKAMGLAAPVTAPAMVRAGRNDPCPCGSGKKFKRCCIDKARSVTH